MFAAWHPDGLAVYAAVVSTGVAAFSGYQFWWREIKRVPKLSLTWVQTTGPSAFQFGHDDASPAGMVLLEVSNAAGRRTAEDVEVLLTMWMPDLEVEDHHAIEGMRLRWYYGDDCIAGEVVTSERIAPGSSRKVALALIGHPKSTYKLASDDRWEVSEEGRAHLRAHHRGFWAVSPHTGATVNAGWVHFVGLTVTAKDVDAVTYFASFAVHERPSPFDPEDRGYKLLNPVLGPLSFDRTQIVRTQLAEDRGPN